MVCAEVPPLNLRFHPDVFEQLRWTPVRGVHAGPAARQRMQAAEEPDEGSDDEHGAGGERLRLGLRDIVPVDYNEHASRFLHGVGHGCH